MSGEVLDHAHIRDASGEAALSPGDDLVDLAQLAVGDALAHLLQRRVVPLDVADSTHQTRLLVSGGDLLGLTDVEGQRLLDQGVDPGLGQGHRHIPMELGGHRHDRVVDARSDQRLHIRQNVQPRRRPRADHHAHPRPRPAPPPPGRGGCGHGGGPSCPARSGRPAVSSSSPACSRPPPSPQCSQPPRSARDPAPRCSDAPAATAPSRASISVTGSSTLGPVRLQAVHRRGVVHPAPHLMLPDAAHPRTHRAPPRRGTPRSGSCTGDRRARLPRAPPGVTTPCRFASKNAAVSCRVAVQAGSLPSWTRPIAAWISVMRLLNPATSFAYCLSIPWFRSSRT